MEGLLFLLFVWAMFGFFAMWVATQKNRSTGEGFMLGMLFGPLGVLIEALLPTQAAPMNVSQPRAIEPDEAERFERYRQADRDQRDRERKAMDEWDRQRAQRLIEKQDRDQAKRDSWIRACESKGITPGPFAWFWLLTDLEQALIAGVTIAAPLVGFIVFMFKGQ